MKTDQESSLLDKLISEKHVFIFVATPSTMKNKDRLYHCAIAAKYHQTMYACVKEGFLSRVYWRRFRIFPWKRIYLFKTKQDLDFVIKEILLSAKKDEKRRTKKRMEEDIAYA